MLSEEMLYEIYSVVEEIPSGKVATYGQIAEMIGYPNHARMIGKALAVSDLYGKYPCHRVVNHIGRLTPGWLEQRPLLEQEGVLFLQNGRVSLKECQWKSTY